MKEVWKDIIGYEGYYQVSNLGNVRTLSRIIVDSLGRSRKTKKKLKAVYRNPVTGYIVFGANVNNKRKTISVHRAKAIAFIPNPENKPQINHRDGNKTNNGYHEDGDDNLEWATVSENRLHAFKIGLQKGTWDGKSGLLHNTSKSVSQYSLDGELVESYGSSAEAYRETGVDRSSICSACRGEYKQAGGFKWKFNKN